MNFIKTPFRLLTASLLFAITLLFASCNNSDTTVAPPNTITDIVSKDSRFTILRAAVVRAGLADALRTGTLTVFAPTDQAFQALFQSLGVANVDAVPVATLTSILQYHVLNSRVTASAIQTGTNTPVQTLLNGANGLVYVTKAGNDVSLNGRRVTAADVPADNGVIHVIDGVLLPPSGDIIATVGTDPNYSLLVAAVTRAGTAVASALTSATAITVFVPTNQAFIDAGLSLSAINATPAAAVARILTYHVVPGRIFSTQLTNNQTTGTLLGATPVLTVGVTGTGVTVRGAGNGTNNSNVTAANIMTTNAVIHRIDRVLLPGN